MLSNLVVDVLRYKSTVFGQVDVFVGLAIDASACIVLNRSLENYPYSKGILARFRNRYWCMQHFHLFANIVPPGSIDFGNGLSTSGRRYSTIDSGCDCGLGLLAGWDIEVENLDRSFEWTSLKSRPSTLVAFV